MTAVTDLEPDAPRAVPGPPAPRTVPGLRPRNVPGLLPRSVPGLLPRNVPGLLPRAVPELRPIELRPIELSELQEAVATTALVPVEPVPRRATATRTGLVGPTAFVMSLGLLGQGVAAAQAWSWTPAAVVAFYWVGLVLIVAPPAALILRPVTSRSQRLVLTVATTLALQFSRFVLFPNLFVFHDELVHQGTLGLIQRTGHLFAVNSQLPVSSAYPGLELVTDGVHQLLGVNNRVAADIVLILARLVLTLSILLIISTITRSQRFACVVTLLYCCNEQYLFFNSQFSYQTLALPLALLTIWLLLRPRADDTRGLARQLGPPMAALAATTITHHLVAILLAAALICWAAVEAWLQPGSQLGRRLRWTALASVCFVGAWILRPGNPALSYLVQIGATSIDAVRSFLGGTTHKLFTDSSGYHAPTWEVVAAVASEITVLVVLGVSVVSILRHRRPPRSSLAVVLFLIACLYPLIPGGHFTSVTSEVTDRASGFVFLGVSFVVAIWLFAKRRWIRGWRSTLVVGLTVLVFIGQVILGSGSQWEQVPGPYLVSADSRSVDAYNLAAANWENEHLPPQTRVLADRVGGLLASAVGGVYTVTHVADDVNASQVLLAPTFTAQDRALIAESGIEFVIVDLRDADGLPRVGLYYESGEYDQARTRPVSRAALTKLNSVPGVQRVYDNGSIVIYDVRNLDGHR